MIYVLLYFLATTLSFGVYRLAHLITEDVRFALWLKYDFFNRRPWNCSICCNFWIGTFISVLGVLLGSWFFGITMEIFTVLYTIMIWANAKYDFRREKDDRK